MRSTAGARKTYTSRAMSLVSFPDPPAGGSGNETTMSRGTRLQLQVQWRPTFVLHYCYRFHGAGKIGQCQEVWGSQVQLGDIDQRHHCLRSINSLLIITTMIVLYIELECRQGWLCRDQLYCSIYRVRV